MSFVSSIFSQLSHHLVCMPGGRCVRSELRQDTMDAGCRQQLTSDLCSPCEVGCHSQEEGGGSSELGL